MAVVPERIDSLYRLSADCLSAVNYTVNECGETGSSRSLFCVSAGFQRWRTEKIKAGRDKMFYQNQRTNEGPLFNHCTTHQWLHSVYLSPVQLWEEWLAVSLYCWLSEACLMASHTNALHLYLYLIHRNAFCCYFVALYTEQQEEWLDVLHKYSPKKKKALDCEIGNRDVQSVFVRKWWWTSLMLTHARWIMS